MKKLIIFRHGDYELNSSDKQLTIRAAKDVFARTKLITEVMGKADIVLTSPVLRAAQTAAVIAKAMGNPRIYQEPLLAEKHSQDKELLEESIIDYALDLECDTIVAVTHYPNIKQAFGVGLEAGMEIIFEAEQWNNIFDKRPSNLFAKIPVHKEDTIEQYFAPRCYDEDLQKLKEIDFLQDKI